MDLQAIEDKYRQLSTEKLSKLTKEAGGLRLEVIPLLQRELLSRGKEEESLSLNAFLDKSKENFPKPSQEEVYALVQQRLAAGEYVESIKIDLKEKGLDIFEVMSTDAKVKNEALDYLATLKEEGHDEAQITTKMKEVFAIDDTQSERLQAESRRKGARKLITGYVLIGISAAAGVAMIGLAGSFSASCLFVLGAGIRQVVAGYTLKK